MHSYRARKAYSCLSNHIESSAHWEKRLHNTMMPLFSIFPFQSLLRFVWIFIHLFGVLWQYYFPANRLSVTDNFHPKRPLGKIVNENIIVYMILPDDTDGKVEKAKAGRDRMRPNDEFQFRSNIIPFIKTFVPLRLSWIALLFQSTVKITIELCCHSAVSCFYDQIIWFSKCDRRKGFLLRASFWARIRFGANLIWTFHRCFCSPSGE